MYEKDVIRTVRLSPVDSQRGFSCLPIKQKMAGDVVHHFGGFLKRSWRSNDILWGRLDGLGQLIDSLMEPERLKAVVADQNLRIKLRNRFHQMFNYFCAKIIRTHKTKSTFFRFTNCGSESGYYICFSHNFSSYLICKILVN